MLITKLRRFVGGRLRAIRGKRELAAVRRAGDGMSFSRLNRNKWEDSLADPTGFYLDCVRWFYAEMPSSVQAHRSYFHSGGRGFGEDAFHVMWHLLCREFQPKSFLEIGVFRGQTLSLIPLLAREIGFSCEVVGVSPFLSAGDAVSRYPSGIDYLADTQSNFQRFGLEKPELVKAYSTDDTALRRIEAQEWDCIYIDGNHDYEVAKADWDVCSRSVGKSGLVVLDDSGLTTSYRPPAFATAGHPGPSKVAAEIDRGAFREILQVGHNRVFQKVGS